MMKARTDDVNHIQKMTVQIAKILVDQKPDIQGAILADLVSMWLASHPSQCVRDAALDLHVETVRVLTPINAAILEEEGV